VQIAIPNLDKKCLLLHDFQLKLRIPVQCHLLVDGWDRMNLPIPTRLDWTMVCWSYAAKGTLEVPQAIAWDPIGKSSVSPIFRQFSNRCIMRFWFTKHLKVHSCVFKWFLEPPQDTAQFLDSPMLLGGGKGDEANTGRSRYCSAALKQLWHLTSR